MALAFLLHYACVVCHPLKTGTVVARGLNCLKKLFDRAISWILELSSEREWVSNSLSNYHDMYG